MSRRRCGAEAPAHGLQGPAARQDETAAPMRRAVVAGGLATVRNKRFVPPMPMASIPKMHEPPADAAAGRARPAAMKQEWSEWLPSNSFGFRPAQPKNRHFPRSQQETAWNLPPRAVPDPQEAIDRLLDAEEYKQVQYIQPWSSDKKGKPFKPPDGAGAHMSDPAAQNRLEWKDIQNILQRERAAMLELDMLDKDGERTGRAHKIVIWVVDSSGAVAAHRSIEVDEVMGGSNEMGLERTMQRMDDSLRIFGRAVLRKLYNLCIHPVEETLRGKRELIIVPCGPLCFVPWAALMNRTGHYLAEAHTIRVVPHMSLIHSIHKRGSSRFALGSPHKRGNDAQSRATALDGDDKATVGHADCQGSSGCALQDASKQDTEPRGDGGGRCEGPRCLVLGNPMPIAPRFGNAEDRDGELLHAKAEVDEAVSALCKGGCTFEGAGGGVKVLLEECCTKEGVMRGMRDAVWVHVAAHVEESMLLLAVDSEAPGGGDDGVMGCDELVSRLRLAPGCTVVLSACNVATSGPSMFELCRAFIASGASAVLISMWSLVDESTCALMRRVYRSLGAGKHLAEALRFAMLQLAGRQFGEEIDPWDNPATPFSMLPYSRPLHWSGLIVVGTSPHLPGMQAPSHRAAAPAASKSPRFAACPQAPKDSLAPPSSSKTTATTIDTADFSATTAGPLAAERGKVGAIRAKTPAVLKYQMWSGRKMVVPNAPRQTQGPPDVPGEAAIVAPGLGATGAVTVAAAPQ